MSSNTITKLVYKVCSHGWSREGTIKCIFGWMGKTTLNGNAIDSFSTKNSQTVTDSFGTHSTKLLPNFNQ